MNDREKLDLLLEIMSDDDQRCFWVIDKQLVINCNDTFSYATADGEDVPEDAWAAVWRIYRELGWAGLDRWVAKRRGYEPLKEIQEDPKYKHAIEVLG